MWFKVESFLGSLTSWVGYGCKLDKVIVFKCIREIYFEITLFNNWEKLKKFSEHWFSHAKISKSVSEFIFWVFDFQILKIFRKDTTNSELLYDSLYIIILINIIQA